jgi:hypothetical protein
MPDIEIGLLFIAVIHIIRCVDEASLIFQSSVQT